MTNPYLSGEYAPVRDEVTVAQLPVTGTLPEHLDGRYLRIGPNPVGDPGDDYHWFLGDGMVHGLRLADGQARWYRNRYVRSRDVAEALGEPPHPGPVFAGLDFSPNTNVIGHAGRTLALVEAGPRPYELSDELETLGPCDFDGTLDGGYTAHPLVDPVTGELHAVSYFFGWGNRVRYTVTGVDGRVRHRVDVQVTGSPMMHSFALTEKYVVLFDLPAVFDARVATSMLPRPVRPLGRLSLRPFIGRNPIPERLVALMARRSPGDRHRTGALPYRWDPAYPARIGLLPRDGSDAGVRWIDVDPCYVFHPVNAYDDGDGIVLDVVRHPKVFDTVTTGPAEGPPTLERWTVDLAAGKVRADRLDDRPQEFPRIDDRRIGRRHRFAYSVGFAAPDQGDSVLRYDLATDTRITRSFGPGRTAGEFTFVANAGADTAEDDGVVMGYVTDAREGRTDLVLLGAQTLADVALVHLPVRVPAGFHGNWLPTDSG